MTDNAIDYAAIRARLEAATEGPWNVETEGWACISSGSDSVVHAYREIRLGEAEGCEYCRDEDAVVSISIEDAELIAHSRTDLEQLLDRVEEARALVASWRDSADLISHLNRAVAIQMRICADELDAALAAAPAVGEEKQ